jgi:hypothetical protein
VGGDSDQNSWGGALCCKRLKTDSVVELCTFKSNWADDNGGALDISRSDRVKISYNHFYSNYTKHRPGDGVGMAIRLGDFGAIYGEVVLRNNMICNSDEDGVYSRGDTVYIKDVLKSYITNNTIANNRSDYRSAVYIKTEDFPCSVDIFNNIIYNNTIGGNKYQLEMHGIFNSVKTLTVELAYNCIMNGSYFPNDPSTYYIYNVIYDELEEVLDLYPDFVDTEGDNFHLDSDSQCDDRGVAPTTPSKEYLLDAYITYSDIDRERRPVDGDDGDTIPEFDLGADEQQ